MDTDELGKALLNQNAGESFCFISSPEHAARVIRRDRRRVLTLAGATILLWLFAAAGVLVSYFSFLVFVLPRVSEMLSNPTEPGNPEGWAAVVRVVVDLGTRVIVASTVAMLLAAICTVLLVFTSRRATLRQISLSLAEISQELARLRPGGDRPAGGT